MYTANLTGIKLKVFKIDNPCVNEFCKLITDGSFNDAIRCAKEFKYMRTFTDSDYKSGINPLNLAIKSQNIDLIKTILKRGVNPNNKDANGKTAFFYAMETHNPEIINLVETYDPDRKNRWFANDCRIS